MCSRRHLAQVVLILTTWVFAAPARGHQDPLGDVHPQVKVEGGRFLVEFMDLRQCRSVNLPGGRLDRRCHRYARVLSPAGQVLEARRLLDPQANYYEQKSDVSRAHGGLLYVFPLYPPEGAERPYVKVKQGNQEKRLQPEWGSTRVAWLQDAQVTDAGLLYLVATGKTGGRRGGAEQLEAVQFDPRGRRSSGLVLGVPAFIYSFPRASGLVPLGPRGWAVAWRDGQEGRLWLSTWQTGDAQARRVELRGKIGWNTTLSAAAVGDRVLVAWHDFDPTVAGAAVKTLVYDLATQKLLP